MSTETQNEKKLTKRGNFNEVFWDYNKEKSLAGTIKGFVTKEIDKEERRFVIIEVEGAPKPYLCGGRDLLNKLSEADVGKYVEVSFIGKESFTPKGTKKKVPINRFDVAVAE